jgi:spore coat protein U-like protein
MRTLTRVSAVVAALFSLATAAEAQSANITAQALVYQPMTVAGAQTLDFGNVFPGVNKTIAVADPTSGRFDLTGQASANVNLTFTLPANLASGGNNLPIGSWTGCHNATNSTTGCTPFTPSGAATASSFSGAGALFVWVGGTVSPAANQAAGTYTGTVTLTAAYF